MNTFVHKTEVLERSEFSTVRGLQEAVGAMQGPGRDDRELSEPWMAELVCETLSDGSEAYSVRLKPTRPVRQVQAA